jgi:hypothetical protein
MKRRDRASEHRPDRAPGQYANHSELIEQDRAALAGETGHEEGPTADGEQSDFEAEIDSHPLGGRPMSDITGRHEPGTGDETIDGLDPLEESVRREAEDRPVGGRRERG